MATWTDLYRKRQHWIAIVKIEKDGRHTPVNGTLSFTTKPTWKQGVPLLPGHIYAAVQNFADFNGDVNNYKVEALVDLTETGWTLSEAKDRSHSLYEQASTSRHAAFDDPQFLWDLCSLGFISEQDVQRNLAAKKAVEAPLVTDAKPTGTLRF